MVWKTVPRCGRVALHRPVTLLRRLIRGGDSRRRVGAGFGSQGRGTILGSRLAYTRADSVPVLWCENVSTTKLLDPVFRSVGNRSRQPTRDLPFC